MALRCVLGQVIRGCAYAERLGLQAQVLQVSRAYVAQPNQRTSLIPSVCIVVCHNPSKCVFVRVVDSCAGCASNSKHVDLTKAAFSSLADLDQGLLSVQMRQATDPEDGWYVLPE